MLLIYKTHILEQFFPVYKSLYVRYFPLEVHEFINEMNYSSLAGYFPIPNFSGKITVLLFYKSLSFSLCVIIRKEKSP